MAALVVLLGWLWPLGFPHAADDDPACAPGLAGKDAGSQIVALSLDVQPEHCQACHSARSFRSTLLASGRIALWLEPGLVVDDPAQGSHANARRDRLPARAPPSHLRTAI